MEKRLTLICSYLILVCSIVVQAQVPIDLSQAKEFKSIWKRYVGGEAGEPKYIPNPCGNVGFDILSVGSSTGGFGCYTQPRMDTTRTVEGWGSVYLLFDYDGVPPLEYLNDNGRVERCTGIGYPFQKERIDTIWCWPGFLLAEFSDDIDADGYVDLVCDIGGAGYTASVIRGGPNVGKKCERVFHIPKVRGHNNINSTPAFWRSASGSLRLLQYEQDSNARSPWLVMYDVVITRENNNPVVSFIQTDSLYGNGIDETDIPIGACAGIADTLAKKDWLLVMRLLDDNQRTLVLERFDATEGKFTPTGEQVTGYEGNISLLGYSLGTDRPVISTSTGMFCYADNIRQPFARWKPQNTGLQPVAGKVAINDQTGDGKPDLIISGGGQNCTVALYTLDSTLTSLDENEILFTPISGRVLDDVLELTLKSPASISAQLITTEGRVFQALQTTQGSVGVNNFDLTQILQSFAHGAYFIRVQVDDHQYTIPFIR